MGKTKFAVIVVVILALGGGMVAGMLVSRLPSYSAAQVVSRSPLAEELGLTPEQNEQMRQVWENVRGKVDDCFARAVELQKRRDERVFALLSQEQKAKFASIQQDCARDLGSLKSERDGAFQEAVRRTEQLLTEKQRQRYREILRDRLGEGSAPAGMDWLSQPPSTSMP